MTERNELPAKRAFWGGFEIAKSFSDMDIQSRWDEWAKLNQINHPAYIASIQAKALREQARCWRENCQDSFAQVVAQDLEQAADELLEQAKEIINE